MASRGEIMPLTPFQAKLGRILAINRSEDSYLAGGAAILIAPNTIRYSQDLDYFHDSTARVASAYENDRQTLVQNRYRLEIEIAQPGYIRAVVRFGKQATKVEWAQDSIWRFMPVIRSLAFGYQLHPIDAATNKVLALAGRDEPRDLLDVLYLHETLLPLGPLSWAATGKDPGFSPLSLLELLRRRGKIRQEDLTHLHLTKSLRLEKLKTTWLTALDTAEAFVRRRSPEEAGCLYYAPALQRFVNPECDSSGKTTPHYGCPGGVLPRIV